MITAQAQVWLDDVAALVRAAELQRVRCGVRMKLLQRQVTTPLVLQVIVSVLDMLSVNGYRLILLHIINLKLTLDLELNSFNDGVGLLQRLLHYFLTLLNWHQVRVELLELVLDLVLDVVEVQRTLACGILSYLQGYLLC